MKIGKLKVLVTGASGQLGLAIRALSASYNEIDFIFTTREQLDIAHKEAVSTFLNLHQPDALINTAAYTAVDKAESEPEAAFLVNEKGVGFLAEACKELEITLLHISTDYVFDGEGSVPYKEEDVTNPQTVYGKSKLAGEQLIQKISPANYYIIRTSWLYSSSGHNFYTTMLRLAAQGKEISVVNDQYGAPTLASELAQVLLHIILHQKSSYKGIYHYSGGGECTWYAFAKAILEKFHPNKHTLYPVETTQYPTPASRPKYSTLNTSKIENTFNISIMHWKNLI